MDASLAFNPAFEPQNQDSTMYTSLPLLCLALSLCLRWTETRRGSNRRTRQITNSNYDGGGGVQWVRRDNEWQSRKEQGDETCGIKERFECGTTLTAVARPWVAVRSRGRAAKPLLSWATITLELPKLGPRLLLQRELATAMMTTVWMTWSLRPHNFSSSSLSPLFRFFPSLPHFFSGSRSDSRSTGSHGPLVPAVCAHRSFHHCHHHHCARVHATSCVCLLLIHMEWISKLASHCAACRTRGNGRIIDHLSRELGFLFGDYGVCSGGVWFVVGSGVQLLFRRLSGISLSSLRSDACRFQAGKRSAIKGFLSSTLICSRLQVHSY